MKKVNFVSAEEMEPVQEGEDTQYAEVCYMSNGQGGYNKGYYNYKANPAMSYRNTNLPTLKIRFTLNNSKLDRVKLLHKGMAEKQLPRPSRPFPGQQMHIPPGFPHQPPQPAPNQEHELKAMLKQLLQGQAEEHGRTWCMDAAQLDTQRKKEEAILKTSSTIYSTNRSSSSTRPAKLQLDRAEKSKSNPKNVASPLTFL
ncbi:unnamed protein product [Microthlaspi erraticum]|uniref:Uncharacterized protein n=1 Tax=Microthlaspi erraticum TaxID=1685480 RepID=A0A6D2HDS1_9BRAS|nr:unnamed protein product [Microthlaspi erraticum]